MNSIVNRISLSIGICLITLPALATSYETNAVPTQAGMGHVEQVSEATLAQLTNEYDNRAQVQGSPEARVTIREFGDYQCPGCAAFEDTIHKLRQSYADNPNVRFIYYDVPLAIHYNARPAAEAAQCAAQQEGFWPYHRALFSSQKQWANQVNPTTIFLDLALEQHLDVPRFKHCLLHNPSHASIDAANAAGQAIQLRATPTIMINDIKFTGGGGYSELSEAIDVALEKTKAKD